MDNVICFVYGYSYDLFYVVVAQACGGHHHLPESGRGTGDRTGTKGIPHQILSLDLSTVDSHYCVDNLLCYVMSNLKVSSQ